MRLMVIAMSVDPKHGRPLLGQEVIDSRLSLKMTASQKKRLLDEAKKTGASPSELIRRALAGYLDGAVHPVEEQAEMAISDLGIRQAIREEVGALLQQAGVITLPPDLEARAQQILAEDKATVEREMAAEKAAIKSTKGSREKKVA